MTWSRKHSEQFTIKVLKVIIIITLCLLHTNKTKLKLLHMRNHSATGVNFEVYYIHKLTHLFFGLAQTSDIDLAYHNNYIHR